MLDIAGEDPLPCYVEGVRPMSVVVRNLYTQKRMYYTFQTQTFHPDPDCTRKPMMGVVGYVEVPPFLETHITSNAMLEWARTKFNERAYAEWAKTGAQE